MKAPLRVATVSIVFGIDSLLSFGGTVQRIETERPPETHRCRRPRVTNAGSACERLPGLDERLQPAEHVHPAACDALRRLRRAFELVMHHGELRDASVLGLDLPGDPALRLCRQIGVVACRP